MIFTSIFLNREARGGGACSRAGVWNLEYLVCYSTAGAGQRRRSVPKAGTYDLAFYSLQSQQDLLRGLLTALEAGGYEAAPTELVQGSALQIEDLQPVLRRIV